MKRQETSRNDTYLKYISYLQVIGIILVVAGHSLHMYPDGHGGTYTLLFRAIYSFHMPLFLFVSGFLMVYTSRVMDTPRYRPGPYIKSKLKRLIIPFVTLTAVTFFPRAMMSGIADDVIEMNARSFAMAFLDNTYMPIFFYWYLQASFILLTVSYCILFFGRKAGISLKAIVAVMFLVMLLLAVAPVDDTTLFSLDMIRKLGLYFMLGAAYSIYSPTIDRYLPWTRIWFFILLALAWGAAFYFFENTGWMILCAVAGIMMCTSAARILEARHCRFLDHLTGANYLIYLLSWYCNVACQQILSHFIALPWQVYSALSLISGIYIPWLGYIYLQRHSDSRWVRFTAFLLGQSLPRKGQ